MAYALPASSNDKDNFDGSGDKNYQKFSLCIKNVPVEVENSDLRDTLENYGSVIRLNGPVKSQSGPGSKYPYRFCDCLDQESMEAIIKGLAENTEYRATVALSALKNKDNDRKNRQSEGGQKNESKNRNDRQKNDMNNSSENLNHNYSRDGNSYNRSNNDMGSIPSTKPFDINDIQYYNCFVCKKPATLCCIRCEEVYCSKECNDFHWPQHKYACFKNPGLMAIPNLKNKPNINMNNSNNDSRYNQSRQDDNARSKNDNYNQGRNQDDNPRSRNDNYNQGRNQDDNQKSRNDNYNQGRNRDDNRSRNDNYSRNDNNSRNDNSRNDNSRNANDNNSSELQGRMSRIKINESKSPKTQKVDLNKTMPIQNNASSDDTSSIASDKRAPRSLDGQKKSNPLNRKVIEKAAFPSSGSQVVITHLDRTLNKVYVRSNEKAHAEDYTNMTVAVHSSAETAKPLTKLPNVRDMVISEFEGGWFRALVLQAESEDKVTIAYVDFGNTETKKLSDLRELYPEGYTFKRYPLLANLKNVPALQAAENEQCQKTIQILIDELTPLKIKYTEEDKNAGNIPSVELFHFESGKSINERIQNLIQNNDESSKSSQNQKNVFLKV